MKTSFYTGICLAGFVLTSASAFGAAYFEGQFDGGRQFLSAERGEDVATIHGETLHGLNSDLESGGHCTGARFYCAQIAERNRCINYGCFWVNSTAPEERARVAALSAEEARTLSQKVAFSFPLAGPISGTVSEK